MTINPEIKIPKRELVSIVSITYNHEKFITQALEGFLAQGHPDFDIEVVIADDDSTDRTQEIISNFHKQHPNLIRPILRKKNIGIQRNLEDALCRAKGDYVALCEGDDYWIDETKLQKQVDYMREHPEGMVCFHPVEVLYEDDATKKEIFPMAETGRVFTFQDLLGVNFIQTNSVMYRRLSEYKQHLPKDILPLDWYMHILHASKSPHEPIGFIDIPMAIYRKHPQGIWQRNKDNEYKFWLERADSHLRMHEAVVKLFEGEPKYQTLAWFSAFATASTAYSVLAGHEDYINAAKLMQEFPEYTIRLIADYKNRFDEQAHRLDDANNKLYQQGVDSAIMQETIANLRAENAHVYRMLGRTFEHKLKQSVHFLKRSLKKK